MTAAIGESPAPLDIEIDRCKGCGLCVVACPHHCLALDESTVNALGYHPISLIHAGACTSCVLCARVCPDSVFTVYAPEEAPEMTAEARPLAVSMSFRPQLMKGNEAIGSCQMRPPRTLRST